MKDLEEELGVPLLVRGQNAVKLTEAGELFYEEAREVLARADAAVRRVRGEARSETLRVGYAPSMVAGIMPAVLERFQSATPRVRIELACLSSREINELAKEGRLDLVISPGISVTKGIPGFQWTELRRLQPVLVMPETHPLAKLKRIPLLRLRELPLIGLAKGNYPEYVPHMRGMLKPFRVLPRFVSLVNDGVSTLFTELGGTPRCGNSDRGHHRHHAADSRCQAVCFAVTQCLGDDWPSCFTPQPTRRNVCADAAGRSAAAGKTLRFALIVARQECSE